MVKVITLVWQDSRRLTHSLYFYIQVYTIYTTKTKSIRLYLRCKKQNRCPNYSWAILWSGQDSNQASGDLNSRPGFATDYLSDPRQVP